MHPRKKNKHIISRVIFWLIYFFAGFILYSKNSNLNELITDYLKIIYPLTIFWLQIRITNKDKWLPINKNMTTSQCWFNLIPVLASLLTVISVLFNLILYLIN